MRLQSVKHDHLWLPTQSVLLLKRNITRTTSRRSAQVREERYSPLLFTPSVDTVKGREPTPGQRDYKLNCSGSLQNYNDKKVPDEPLRTLSPLLPSLLTSPHSIPPSILAPGITLHLFPSTHPHLPTVHGKVPYRAALWTAPVAWGSFPIVGNAKLRILSEKIARTGFMASPKGDDGVLPGIGEEKLIVRWKTHGKEDRSTASSIAASSSTRSIGSTKNGINKSLSLLLGGDKPIFNLSTDQEFNGLFVFSFDDEGRVANHTIEHTDEDRGMDRTSRVVTLADWLLGRVGRGRIKEEGGLLPGLAFTGHDRTDFPCKEKSKSNH
ncbi:MAG: hypothetical protein Q9160_008996 [Pyrenula sp. 1 TL-2023]